MFQKLNPETNLFVFDDVPPNVKYPFGGFRQVPSGYPFAGGWMFVYPFNPDPWTELKGGDTPIPQVEIVLGGAPKEGFIETHGPMPDDKGDRKTWADAHPQFKFAGIPAELKPVAAPMLALAGPLAVQWKMGEPKPYVGAWGPMVRFPFSGMFDWECSLHTWTNFSHGAIVSYQQDLWTYEGVISEPWHPGVPPVFLGQVSQGIR